MKYPKELYGQADAILSQRRQCAAADLDVRKSTLPEKYPDIYRLHQDLTAAGVRMGKAMLGCTPEQREGHIAEFKALEEDFLTALANVGLPPNYLQVQPQCPPCEDKGFVQGHSCQCRQALLNRLAYGWLSNISRVEECSFDNFSLDYYEGENAQRMEKLLVSCKRYAGSFTLKSPDLLFMGPPGLGKTHLSLSIAREVVHSGFLVLYAAAGKLLDRLVDISFNNKEDEYKDIVYGCDLLIVDDLGTEFQTRFTKSEVYSIINTRQLERRPTIINTNLSLQELEKAYDERVLSRLANNYKVNVFGGKNIRFQKQWESMKRRERA